MKILFKRSILVLVFFGLFFSQKNYAQELPIEKIEKQIDAYKKDIRGPYYRIKWFCEDGSIRNPKDYCPEGVDGIQHASYKPEIENLAKKHDLYFGNILASLDHKNFWDEANHQSRLKQYQLVKFLQNADNGWIYRKGQFYRGAMQSEDEQEWGKNFFKWLLSKDDLIKGKYFLLRQSLKDIPHSGDSNLAQKMRSESKVLAEQVSSFMKLRIKIHGNPEKRDIQAVKEFASNNNSKLTTKQRQDFEKLIATMQEYYKPLDLSEVKNMVAKFSNNHNVQLDDLLSKYNENLSPIEKTKVLAPVLYCIGSDFDEYTANEKLIALDVSNKLENAVFQNTQGWEPTSLNELLEKIDVLTNIAAATGLIELWEYNRIKPVLSLYKDKDNLTIQDLNTILTTSRGVVEWSTSMVKANYEEIVETYMAFEPLAYGFVDDRIRSSITLDLGNSVSQLGNFISKESSINNEVVGVKKQATVRGLNPGYAYGELVVVEGSIDNIEFKKDKIYVFNRPPSGLKPVAGIMTVSEGNLVSHVQLLARNLGVPNAALSQENLEDLSKFNGKKVFYAVSSKGNVILKTEDKMTQAEKGLFTKVEKSNNKITVPVDRIRLDQVDILNMREVDASDSGKLCGPKAANLAQLKSIFPDHVVEGFIIPFGIFRKHLDNEMTGENMTYWEFLTQTYAQCEAMKKENKSDNEVEAYQFKRLNKIRVSIENMQLNPEFITQLEDHFKKAFNTQIGELPVFLRSDTNMEDLKEFTGAGLNLTLFNIKTKENIINGIKEVWASPFTERSLKWRQKYLLNPEYVFPSILVIPGVNVDYSGVVITTGINAGDKDDLTIAFSRGAGGAVEGQIAETRNVTDTDDQLLSPAREPLYTFLPSSGGVIKKETTFDEPILSQKNIQTLREMVKEVREKMPKYSDSNGPYDMEMGFKDDKLWLFQIRPFVENKKAKSSGYLNSITPKIDYSKKINLNSKI